MRGVMNGNRLHIEAVQSVCPWRHSKCDWKSSEQPDLTWKLGLLGEGGWTKHPPEVPSELNLSMTLICNSTASILMEKELPEFDWAKSLMWLTAASIFSHIFSLLS